MKLVDILARDLKEWPEGVESLSQVKVTKVTGYIINGKGFDCRAFDALEIADETHIAGAIVTRLQWQAAVDALKGEKVVEWNSEELPPVGMHVHIYDPEGVLMYGHGESGEVVAHVENTAVVRMSYGLGCFTVKHLRTPEQIAAEERESEINRMVATASMIDKGWARKVCAELYDASYRRQGEE